MCVAQESNISVILIMLLRERLFGILRRVEGGWACQWHVWSACWWTGYCGLEADEEGALVPCRIGATSGLLPGVGWLKIGRKLRSIRSSIRH